ncbi:unnamed protein product [Symbiodinium sp. CCMP2592]|nr:unnamed protein product [Symbiodinium sp. CCMP2592]
MDLRKWWDKEGHRIFMAASAAQPEDEEEEDDKDDACIVPGDVEVTEHLQEEKEPEQQQADIDTIQRVHDRAVVMEEALEFFNAIDKDEPGAAIESIDDVEPQKQDKDQFDKLFPLDAEDQATQHDDYPKTLAAIVHRALKKEVPVCQLGTRKSLGLEAMLKRVTCLIGGIRQFSRLVRLEEGLVSLAALEKAEIPMNSWNQRQHELAIARQAMNLSQCRLSRAQAWSQAQAKYVDHIKGLNKQVSDKDPGLQIVNAYRPNRDGSQPQILALRLGSEIRLAAVLSVFRGSVVRKMNSKSYGRVRVSKPVSVELPADCTRMLHLVPLEEHPDQQRWIGSCAAVPMLLDPNGIVQGEVGAKIHSSATRLHVMPTPAAIEAIRHMSDPKVPPPNPLPTEPAAEENIDMPGTSEGASKQMHFNDRSFAKRQMPQNVMAFLRGLRAAYLQVGEDFVCSDGSVKLEDALGRVSWESLVSRAPSYFEKTCADLKGYKFSQQVYLHLTELLPKNGKAPLKLLVGFLSRVASATAASVVLSVA